MRGVSRLAVAAAGAVAFLETAAPFRRDDELKTDEAALVWELVEETVFRMSPARDSVSSVAGWAASDTEPSRRDLDTVGSSWRAAARMGVWRPLGEGEWGWESAVLVLALSRSLARSLAALGAAGKNWAKLAPEGGGIARIWILSPLPPSSAHHNWGRAVLDIPCICLVVRRRGYFA